MEGPGRDCGGVRWERPGPGVWGEVAGRGRSGGGGGGAGRGSAVPRWHGVGEDVNESLLGVEDPGESGEGGGEELGGGAGGSDVSFDGVVDGVGIRFRGLSRGGRGGGSGEGRE